MPGPEDEEVAVRVVAIKLPQFWPEQPYVWFAQAESQFALKHVTVSLTKFHHVVSVLPQQVAAGVLDLIRSPPSSNPYTTLKARLEQTYALSDYQRAEHLVNLPALGDQRPSHLMNQMLALLPDKHEPGFIFKFMFLQRLPSKIRTHLVGVKFDDLRALSNKADELWSAQQRSHLAVLSPSPVPAQEEEVLAVSAPRNRRQDSSRQQDNRRPDNRQSYCFYHSRFGDRAQRCESPCSFRPSTVSGNSKSGRRR